MTVPQLNTGPRPPADDELRQASASRAFIWSLVNTVSARLGTLAIGVALARLLGPEEFGTYAVAFIALLAVLSFNELGVSLAIVRWTTDPREIAPTVTAISLATSGIIAGAMALVAGPFATAMGDPAAANLVRLLILCVVINGAVATPSALLQRYFRQDKRMICDQINVWVGAIISLGLALSGSGAISLVIGRLAGAVASGLLLIAYSPLPYRIGLDRRYVRPLLRFGWPLAGASIIVFAVGFIDQFTVGHVVGSVALGYYVLAFNLASWPVSIFSQPLRSVAPAMFARLQGDSAAMADAFIRVLRVLAAVALPSCLLLAAAADDVIGFVYGSEWAPAATALRWLCIMAAFRIFFELTYDYLVVLRRSQTILIIQVIWLVALGPIVLFGVQRWGMAGAGAALVFVAAAIGMPLYLHTLSHAGIPVVAIVRHTLAPLIAAIMLGASTLLISTVIAGPFTVLVASGTLGLTVIAGLLWKRRDDLAVLRHDDKAVPS